MKCGANTGRCDSRDAAGVPAREPLQDSMRPNRCHASEGQQEQSDIPATNEAVTVDVPR
jgi:hypothetical protein